MATATSKACWSPSQTGKPDAGPALIMGAGGAARAVLVSLAEKGVKDIRVCNRTEAHAADLVAAFKDDFAQNLGTKLTAVPWAQRHEAVADVALLVNTTSQGMGSNPRFGYQFGPTAKDGFGLRRGLHPHGNPALKSRQSARQPHRWRPEHAAAPSPPSVSQMVWRAARGDARAGESR